MAETEYSTTTALAIDDIWEFVSDMDLWGHLLTGYQKHEKHSEADSVWTLKGDLGAMQRTVTFEVHISEWSAAECVRFDLRGVNEQLTGEGEFRLSAGADVPAEPASAAPGWLSRAVAAVLRLFHRWMHGAAARSAIPNASGNNPTRLTFRLRIEPGGPMAPMINAMLKPALSVAAEDLANRIIGHLESVADRSTESAAQRS